MDKPSRISFEEFTETTLNSTLSALKQQRLITSNKLPFPIIFGLIFWPDDFRGGVGPVAGVAREQTAEKE